MGILDGEEVGVGDGGLVVVCDDEAAEDCAGIGVAVGDGASDVGEVSGELGGGFAAEVWCDAAPSAATADELPLRNVGTAAEAVAPMLTNAINAIRLFRQNTPDSLPCV